MTRAVWIDGDCGFDDMVAIEMVRRAPWIDIVGCSLVAGNAPLSVVAANAGKMAAFLGWRFPLHLGRDRPLIGPLVTAQSVLGDDGLRTTGARLPLPSGEATIGADAIGAMIDALERAPEPVDLLAIGPLTNVAIALLARPSLVAKIARLVWMGGSATTGNHTAAAEFNALVDPEAVQIVVESGAPFEMVGLDCCRQVRVSIADAADLRAKGAGVLADLLDGYARIVSPDGSMPHALYDPVAAAAIVEPASVTFEPAHVEVERGAGPARGMTVTEFRARKRAPNARVASLADGDAVRRLALGALMPKGSTP